MIEKKKNKRKKGKNDREKIECHNGKTTRSVNHMEYYLLNNLEPLQSRSEVRAFVRIELRHGTGEVHQSLGGIRWGSLAEARRIESERTASLERKKEMSEERTKKKNIFFTSRETRETSSTPVFAEVSRE
jgi:hypothetical protein